jgi:ectoine hydroxylase-related dioxygenase (phytanoyl-CoA dioxygenase family)
MISTEYYLFDCFGLYHKKNVFNKQLIDQANQVFESQIFKTGSDNLKFFDIDKDKVFIDLILSDHVIDACNAIYSCNYRLDHAFILNQSEKNSHSDKNKLHGKHFGKFNAHFHISYQQENINHLCVTKVGQLSVGIVLKNQNKDTGGFCYIPGSHKTAYCVSGQELVATILSNEKNFYESVVIPELNEGDLVIFSESLIHGQSKMLKPHVRRNIYGMFFPISMNYMNPKNQQIQNFAQIVTDKKRSYLISNIDDIGNINNEFNSSKTNRKLFIS